MPIPDFNATDWKDDPTRFLHVTYLPTGETFALSREQYAELETIRTDTPPDLTFISEEEAKDEPMSEVDPAPPIETNVRTEPTEPIIPNL